LEGKFSRAGETKRGRGRGGGRRGIPNNGKRKMEK
jgi:hypothetical protein